MLNYISLKYYGRILMKKSLKKLSDGTPIKKEISVSNKLEDTAGLCNYECMRVPLLAGLILIAVAILIFRPTISQVNAQQNTLLNGLISYWSMNETTGNTVADFKAISNGNSTNTTIVDGKFGKARRSTGNGYTTANDNAAYNFTNFTVAAWVNPSTFGEDNYASIYSRRTAPQNKGMYLELNGDEGAGSGQMQCHLDFTSGDMRVKTSAAKLTANSWNLAVCSYDGTSLKVYINNILAGTSSKTGTAYTSPGMNISIGRNPIVSSVLSGTIDEVALWNRPLTTQELTTLYNNGQGTNLTSLAVSPSPSPTVSPATSPSVSPSPAAKVGDLDHDNDVDLADMNIFVTDFLKNPPNNALNLNNDNKIDLFDFNVLVTNFGI